MNEEGALPTIGSKPKGPAPAPTTPPGTKPTARKPTAWPHLIPNLSYGVTWTAQLQRHREIWEELQFKLELTEHPNAISVLFRVLIELSVDHYIRHTKLKTIMDGDKLARRAAKVAEDMFAKGLIEKKYFGAINKLQQHEGLISMDTLKRYVHSPNFIVSPEHLKMIWGTLSDFIVLCLKA